MYPYFFSHLPISRNTEISDADLLFVISTMKLLSRRSRATRAQVGCIIWNAQKRTIVSLGYNGTPAGADNTMEMNGRTLESVIHAEDNALRKLSYFTCPQHLIICITHAPCLSCARKIVASGIRRVYYLDPYGDALGLRHLREHGITSSRILLP